MSYFVLNEAGIAEAGSGPEATAYLEACGGRVRDSAKSMAPVLTGRGVASIHYEMHGDEVRIMWGSEAYYLYWNELGSGHQPARPFLRPALGAA